MHTYKLQMALSFAYTDVRARSKGYTLLWEPCFLKSFFYCPLSSTYSAGVFESHIHHSFAYKMEVAEDIDYKELYEGALLSIDALKEQLAQLKKVIFGSKHERYIPTDNDNDSTQLTLDLDAATIAACKITSATKISYIRTRTEVTFNKPKAHPGRMKLPEACAGRQ